MSATLRLLARPALLLAGLVLMGGVVRLLSGGAEREWLAHSAALHGMAGPVWFALLGALLTAVGVPRQAVAFAGGYAFGTAGGVALALVAQLSGCGLDFLWARMVGQRWVRRRLQARIGRLDRFLAAHPFSATLSLRLLPVGNNVLLNLAAGISAVPWAPFLAGSALGYLPQTVIFALLGAGVQVQRSEEIAVGIALFAIAAALGLILLRRWRMAGAWSA